MRLVSQHARSVLAVAGVLSGLALASAQAAVQLPPVLSSHMVLQRDIAVPVWGTAAAGEEITVEFAGQKKSAKADDAGKWKVLLDPLAVSAEPRTLTVTSSAGGAPLQLEDVLVGDVWLGSGQSNMAGGVNGYARGDSVLATNAAGTYPLLRLLRAKAGWQPATPETIGAFSALHFSFGLPLQKELGVPVGLMYGAVGGTPSGFWLSEEAYKADAACQELVAKEAATYDEAKAVAAYSNALARWQEESAKVEDPRKKPRQPAPPVRPGACRGKIGNLYDAHIRPLQPFAIRGVLWDQGESGTAIERVDQYTLMGALIRGWRKEWGQGDFPFLYVQKPSGEGCAWDPADPVTAQASKFAALPATAPADGEYREEHIRILQYPNTFMVTSTDLGAGIHPVCKSGYGARAARVALGAAYGRPVEFYGPLYKSHAVEGAKVRVQFTHAGKGLAFKGGEKLQGFAVAGEDKKFHWAEAVIEGDAVVVSSADVPAPVAVRYAWSQRHPWANLFNQDGLPAPAFRTDTW